MTESTGSADSRATVEVDRTFLTTLMRISGESDPTVVMQRALRGLLRFHNAEQEVPEVRVIFRPRSLRRPRPPASHVRRL